MNGERDHFTPEEEHPQRPRFERKYEVPLAESEFILNAGHYTDIKDIAKSWVDAGFAWEFEIGANVYLVIDTNPLIAWIEKSLKEHPLEKFNSYVVVVLGVVISLSSEEKEFSTRWTTVLRKILELLQPNDIEKRAQQIVQTISTIEMEVRQLPTSTDFFTYAREDILELVQAHITEVQDEGLSQFRHRIISGEVEAKMERIKEELEASLIHFNGNFEWYLHSLDVAKGLVETLVFNLPDEVWRQHPQVAEQRKALSETIGLMMAKVPSSTTVRSLYREMKNAIGDWRTIIEQVKNDESVSAEVVKNALITIETELKN